MELNVFFEGPFWIGMFYVKDGKDIYVEKVVLVVNQKMVIYISLSYITTIPCLLMLVIMKG